MSDSIAKRVQSAPVKSLDSICLNPAKASLPVNRGQRAMTAVVKDALLRHFGSLKAAAISMSNMDEGQLSRELESGKFKFERLDVCEDAAKAAVTAALYDAFGQTDPRSQIRRDFADLENRLRELRERTEALIA